MLNRLYKWIDSNVNRLSYSNKCPDEITTFHFLPGIHYNKDLFYHLNRRKKRHPPVGLNATLSDDGYVLVSNYFNPRQIKSLLIEPYLLKKKEEIDRWFYLTEVTYFGFGLCRIRYQYGLIGSLTLATSKPRRQYR